MSDHYGGKCEYSRDDNKLYCSINTKNEYSPLRERTRIDFAITIYYSKLWLNKYKLNRRDIEDIESNKEAVIYIVSIERQNGHELMFRKIKNEVLLMDCRDILRGLPLWARRMQLKVIGPKQLLIAGFMRECSDDISMRISDITAIVWTYIGAEE